MRSPAAPLPLSLLLALVLAAMALRPQLVALGPLEGRIRDELGISRAGFGALTTVSLLAMGLCAPLASPVAARLGTRRAVALGLGGTAVAGLVRVAVPGYAAVLTATLLLGLAMGFANALPAVVVKERLAWRATRGTAAYTTGIQIGAALATALAVPLAALLGGWRAALAALALSSALALAGWLLLVGEHRGAPQASTPAALPRELRPLRLRLVALYAALSATYYGTVAWLPDALADDGWSRAAAGWALGLLGAVSIVSVVVLGVAAERWGSPRAWTTAGGVAMGAALAGVVAAPGLAWGWAVLFGAGNGLAFASAFALALDATSDARHGGALVGTMLLGGLLLAAVVPPALGLARDLTGSHAAGLLVLSAACASVGLLAHGCARSSAELRMRLQSDA